MGFCVERGRLENLPLGLKTGGGHFRVLGRTNCLSFRPSPIPFRPSLILFMVIHVFPDILVTASIQGLSEKPNFLWLPSKSGIPSIIWKESSTVLIPSPHESKMEVSDAALDAMMSQYDENMVLEGQSDASIDFLVENTQSAIRRSATQKRHTQKKNTKKNGLVG